MLKIYLLYRRFFCIQMRNIMMHFSYSPCVQSIIIDIIIMQESLAKSVHSSHMSEDYQSISSQQQLDFTKQEIRFPPQPPQFAFIYDIYTKTTDKIRQLHEKVSDLEERILELQRCKQNSKYDENALQVLDEIEDQSEFMTNYGMKCESRQKELQSLDDIYSGLKKLNSEVSICQNTKITQAIMNYIQSHRKVICYAPLKENILVLCRETHHKKKNYIAILTGGLNKSVSGDSSGKKQRKRRDSKDETQDPQEKIETSFSLRLINTKNLIYNFLNKTQGPILDVDFSAEQLEEIKLHVQKQVNILKFIKTHPSKKVQYLHATYSVQEKCYALLDQAGKLSLVDSAAETKSFKLIDKVDKVVCFQVKMNSLWVGTSEGVLRLYSIKDCKLNLKQIFSCFNKDSGQVNSYMLIGDQTTEKVLFSINRSLLQLNINTFQIKPISQLADKVEYVVDKYFITSEQICKLTIQKDKYQLSRNEKLNQWYYAYHSKNADRRILHIEEGDKLSHIVVGDPKGNINVISI